MAGWGENSYGELMPGRLSRTIRPLPLLQALAWLGAVIAASAASASLLALLFH